MQDWTSLPMVSGEAPQKGDVRYSTITPLQISSPTSRPPRKDMKEKKKRAYGQRVREVQHAYFSQLVFSLIGGLGREASCVVKRLASSLATKWKQPYSITLNWMGTSYSYALLRSSIRCLRGARSRCGQASCALNTPVDVICAESLLTNNYILH